MAEKSPPSVLNCTDCEQRHGSRRRGFALPVQVPGHDVTTSTSTSKANRACTRLRILMSEERIFMNTTEGMKAHDASLCIKKQVTIYHGTKINSLESQHHYRSGNNNLSIIDLVTC